MNKTLDVKHGYQLAYVQAFVWSTIWHAVKLTQVPRPYHDWFYTVTVHPTSQ